MGWNHQLVIVFTLRISQDLKSLVGTGDPSQNKFPSFLAGVQWVSLRVTNNGLISVPIGSNVSYIYPPIQNTYIYHENQPFECRYSKYTVRPMGKPSWGIMYPISRFYNGDSHCGESRCLATPQRWQFVRGHVKPMGVCTIYFPGGIKTLMKSKMRGLVGGLDRSRAIFQLLQTLFGKLGMMKHGKLTWQWNIAIFNRRYIIDTSSSDWVSIAVLVCRKVIASIGLSFDASTAWCFNSNSACLKLVLFFAKTQRIPENFLLGNFLVCVFSWKKVRNSSGRGLNLGLALQGVLNHLIKPFLFGMVGTSRRCRLKSHFSQVSSSQLVLFCSALNGGAFFGRKRIFWGREGRGPGNWEKEILGQKNMVRKCVFFFWKCH